MSNYSNDGAATLNNQTNIHNEDMGFSSHDQAVVKAVDGRFTKHVNYISDEEMNNNPANVIRDGSRVSAGGGFQAGDLVLVNGMEIPAQTAIDMGLIANPNEPQLSHDVAQGEHSIEDKIDQAPEQERQALEGTDLLIAQMDMQTEGKGIETLNDLAGDIVEEGFLTDETYERAMSQFGLSEASVNAFQDQATEAGNAAVYDSLEVGDGLGVERMEMLQFIHDNGTAQDARTVRQMIAGAGLGHLGKSEVVDMFDALYGKYEG